MNESNHLLEFGYKFEEVQKRETYLEDGKVNCEVWSKGEFKEYVGKATDVQTVQWYNGASVEERSVHVYFQNAHGEFCSIEIDNESFCSRELGW